MLHFERDIFLKMIGSRLYNQAIRTKGTQLMNNMGNKIASARKNLGMTQQEMADRLSVTRQTVSRWEAGSVLPDIDKLPDIASMLGVSCDYLLMDDIDADDMPETAAPSGVGRLLTELKGSKVKLDFFEDQADIDLFNKVCTVEDFEGNWVKISAEVKKETVQKLIPLSSILSFEKVKE